MVIITTHAFDRAKERAGLNKSACRRLSELAFVRGLTREQVTGTLKSYLDHEFVKKSQANNLRLYGGKMFVFCDDTLVTICNLPKAMIPMFNKLWKRRRT